MAINPNWPLLSDQAAFNVGASDPWSAATWVELTGRVTDRSFTMGRSFELDKLEAGTASYTCDNADEALNPGNPTSPYAGLLLPYRRIRTTAMWPLTGNILNNTQAIDLMTTNIFWGSGASDFESIQHGWTGGGTTPPGSPGLISSPVVHGTKAGQVVWPTGAGGESVSRVQSPAFTSWWGLKVGEVYTYSIYVEVFAGNPAVSINVRGGATILGGTTTTSINGAYQRLSVTFRCTDPTNNVLALFPATASTSGQFCNIDACQLELGNNVSAYTTAGPQHHLLYLGYIEQYPTRWDNQGRYGWTDLKAVDELATIAQTTFVDAVLATRLNAAADPTFCYPLTDESGSTAAGDQSGTTQPQLTTVQAGTGSGTVTFAVNDGPTGVAAPVVNFAPGSISNGRCLGAQLSTALTANGGPVLMAWFRTTATPSQPAVIAAVWNGVNDYAEIVVGTDGGVYVRVNWTGGAEIVSPAGSTGPYNDGQWHHAALLLDYNSAPVTAKLYVDNAGFTPVNTSNTIPTSWKNVYVGGTPKGRLFSGDVCYVTGYPGGVDPTTDLWQSGNDGFAGDAGYQRVQRLLTWFGHTNSQVYVDSATTMQGCQVHNGKSILRAVQDVADTDGGGLWVKFGGLWYADRNYWFRQTTSSVTFGENETGGEIPYEADAKFSLDPTYVYNDVAVTRANGITSRRTDTASQNAYFPRTYPLTVYSASDADVADHTNFLLAKYAQPANRPDVIRVDSARRPATWTTMLGDLFAQRATVKRRLNNGQVQTIDGFVDQVTRDIGRDSWVATLRLAPAAGSTFLIVGDATYGLVGTGRLGW